MEIEDPVKDEMSLSKFRFSYFMHLGSINKFQAIITGILVTLMTSFLIFFLQEGSFGELLDIKILLGIIFGLIIALLIFSFYMLKINIDKKKKDSNNINEIEKRYKEIYESRRLL